MIALLVHFLGYLLVDSAVPPYIGSADAYFLATWYAAFAAVDLVAVALSTGMTKIVLRLSFAWSCALVVEQMLLLDYIQQYDWAVQQVLDAALFCMLVYTLLRAVSAKAVAEQ